MQKQTITTFFSVINSVYLFPTNFYYLLWEHLSPLIWHATIIFCVKSMRVKRLFTNTSESWARGFKSSHPVQFLLLYKYGTVLGSFSVVVRQKAWQHLCLILPFIDKSVDNKWKNYNFLLTNNSRCPHPKNTSTNSTVVQFEGTAHISTSVYLEISPHRRWLHNS